MALASPAWTKDLIIYKVATKAFTSPAGPESGNFKSLTQRLPYLAELFGLGRDYGLSAAGPESHHRDVLETSDMP